MERQQQTKKHNYTIILFLLVACKLFAQATNEKVKLVLNDSADCSVTVQSAKSIALSSNDKKVVNMLFWPNHAIRNMLVRQNDSTFLQFSFNYVSALISQKQYIGTEDALIAHGLHYHYTDQGTLSHIYTYVKGEMHGNYKSYYPDGVLESSGNYSHGDKKGLWRYYSEKGNLLKTSKF